MKKIIDKLRDYLSKLRPFSRDHDIIADIITDLTLSQTAPQSPQGVDAPNTELLRDCRDALSRPTGDHDDKVRNMALLNRIDNELGGK